MIELSSVDVHYAVEELQALVGAKVEKAYQGDGNKRDVLLQLYCADGKKRNLRILLPGMLCLPQERPAYPKLPPGFAMFLRKRLTSARITTVSQVGFDRIINIAFDSRRSGGTLTLVIELVAPGNILLLDSDSRIINLLENQQYKDRTLRPHHSYVPPPPSYDLLVTDDDALASHLTASTRQSIVTTLALHCGLGGTYAEEVCARADIPKHRNDLTQEEIQKVVRALREVLIQPVAAAKDEHRAYPFALKSKETTPCEDSLFLGALCELVTDEDTARPTKAEARKLGRASPRAKLLALIEAQAAQTTRLEAQAAQEQRKGEIIYTHYGDVQEMLALVREARKEKSDVTAGLRGRKGFIAYNDSNGELTLELPEE
jgi:predicted ribosome quality control (RQC) complex YloA/Tae2 family protein